MVQDEFKTSEIASQQKIDFVIIGSGISGLSTAYFLEKQNHKNYIILEADKRIGGNSACEKNDLSGYPLGAHYLPIVRNDDQVLLNFLNEIEVISGYKNNLPIYNEDYLCGAPHERLFIKGRWQENIIPQYAASQDELSEMKDFLNYVDSLRNIKGQDGKFVFSIPLDKSSQDPKWLALDKISFREFLDSKNFKSEYIGWYANYCCRDDFGLEASETSAWAGLHYFASRNGLAANAEPQSILTWPQGNGFLVEHLSKKLSQKVKTLCTVRKVEKTNDGYNVYFLDQDLKTHLIQSKKIVYATPKAVVKHIQPSLKFSSEATAKPWLLANIKIKKEALEEKSSLCWDNVRFGSSSLGYINSSQQVLAQDSGLVNITFYHSYSEGSAKDNRKALSKLTSEELYAFVLNELKKMHPLIEGSIEEIQFKILGHGMVGPVPGYIWGQRLEDINAEPQDLIFSHTDRAGISIFEEGFHQGLRAAKLLTGV